LTLANLAAAFYSVRQQDLSYVKEIVIVDNGTKDPRWAIQELIDAQVFPIPVHVLSFKHNNLAKTHSWSTNVAVRATSTPWVLFTRADYLLRFDLVKKFVETIELTPDWNGFVTGNGCHLGMDIAACEQTTWREHGPDALRGGSIFDYTNIDAGVWMARRDAFERVHGLDEALTAWGHAQTHFQYKMHLAGTEFVRIPEVLFYHPQHSAERDLGLAHQQLAECGVDLRQMWARYDGPMVY
jgi:GT2 family glycosyltransferase